MAGGKLEHFCVGMRAILGAGVLPIFVLLVDSLVGRGQFINVPQGAGKIIPPPPRLSFHLHQYYENATAIKMEAEMM
jgi:hypothetical protein